MAGCRTGTAFSKYLHSKWLNCCVSELGVPPPTHRLNYCGQMDNIQQISMAFCESDAIFICGMQWDEIKMCMKNILVFPQGLSAVCTRTGC